MKLYHGTNCDFVGVQLEKCRPNKDFGRGFYLTNIRSQAQEMAIRQTEFTGSGTPVVQEYQFDEELLKSSGLKVKIFEGVSKEWAEFILMNLRLVVRRCMIMTLWLVQWQMMGLSIS